MKYFSSLFLCFCLFSMISCGSGETKKTAETQTTAGPKLPSVSPELMNKLYNECTYIDYIFYELPFAMSQNEQGSIRANLNYISQTALGAIPSQCKAIGRQFFHIDGDIVAEADVYYSDKCKFYVFVQNDKPIYANLMSEEGDKFFTSMLQQAMQSAGGQ